MAEDSHSEQSTAVVAGLRPPPPGTRAEWTEDGVKVQLRPAREPLQRSVGRAVAMAAVLGVGFVCFGDGLTAGLAVGVAVGLMVVVAGQTTDRWADGRDRQVVVRGLQLSIDGAVVDRLAVARVEVQADGTVRLVDRDGSVVARFRSGGFEEAKWVAELIERWRKRARAAGDKGLVPAALSALRSEE